MHKWTKIDIDSDSKLLLIDKNLKFTVVLWTMNNKE